MEPIQASALAQPQCKANPYPFYARMRAENPVFPISVPFFGRGWVAGVLGSANRDESVFKDPDTLDLARDPNPHVALGQGRHFCLGASLARMEAQIALTTLFARFPGLRLAQPAESLRWRRFVPRRALAELPVAGLA